MADNLKSNWTIPQLLAHLPDLIRSDDGWDLLACRLTILDSTRSAYIYLYGLDPDVIWFDLEDTSATVSDWDNAVQCGKATSLTQLREVVYGWLRGSGEPSTTV